MNIAYFLIKDIFRKRLRVFLTICGVAIGVCVCIIMLGIGESIKESFKDIYGKRQIDLVIQEKEQLSILLGRVNEGLAQKARALPQVEGTASTLLYLHKMKGSALPVFGWDTDGFLFDGIDFIQGRKPVAGMNEVIIGDALAKNLQKENENRIKIKNESFVIVGTFKSGSPFEQFSVVMPLTDLQKTIHEEGRVSFINLRLKPQYRSQAEIEKVIEEIELSFPQVAVLGANAFISEKTSFIVMGEKFSFLVSLITVIAVALGLANTMVTSSFEKRKFLAILLALGWQKAEIAILFLCESLIVAALGGSIGIILGLKGTAFILGLTSINVFVPALSISFILKIIGLILGSAVFAAAIPTWITLNSNPVETIRGE